MRLDGIVELLDLTRTAAYRDMVASARPLGGNNVAMLIRWVEGSVRDLTWAVERIRRLEAALTAAKQTHAGDGPACPVTYLNGPCDAYLCGADAHNAAIDAALTEEP